MSAVIIDPPVVGATGRDHELNAELATPISAVACQLIALPGVGVDTAGQLLVTAGDNPGRLTSEAKFARRCGAAPNPCLVRPHEPVAQDQQLVAQHGGLHVFGVRRRAKANQTEDVPDDHERQGTHHHGLIMAGRRRAWSQP